MRKFIPILLIAICACTPSSRPEISHEAKPWVFWYWMKASVSKAGITADLEAMKQAGIGGAYLMPIQGPEDPPYMDPVIQLSPEWWEMVKFSMQEAQRLGLEIGMHASDGFALAGGPWITPELSMQKVVWSETFVREGPFNDTLKIPEYNEDYYVDLGVYALPLKTSYQTTLTNIPSVTSSTDTDASHLVVDGDMDQFRCKEDCWFQYSFDEPFTCQSIEIITKGNNYQSHRLMVEASQDGVNFEQVYQMVPPRHGWQDTDANVTYAIPKTTAKHYRFQWRKEGTEPGAEDLDAAKWGPTLKIAGLKMSSQPKIHQYEGKSGVVWRISPRTTSLQLSEDEYYGLEQMVNLTDQMDSAGILTWEVPEGEWIILRMGHTSTGHTNYTGGGALGLECDKFNPKAINTQFDGWYGEIVNRISPEYKDVLTRFHIDSWECGSQNWSPVFRDEFINRRGYDPLDYLPLMAGIPLQNSELSEGFLYDIRETISELTIDNFYGIMSQRAHEHNTKFSAENVAPTMLSDGMRHFGVVDLPMGEFWLESPTHDKPNDMLDAISGAHIYGKQIIQAEGFTQLRQEWDEYPAMIKAVQDRNYAFGINKLFYHVYAHNPWTDRQPGMTLGPIGLFFQRDQTWWEPGREWVAYADRCQQLLQEGMPVTDIAVFTGEGLPRRSILPDRLVTTLPGIFGPEVVEAEQIRLKNEGQPQREMPAGIRHSANMADPEDWLDPLGGYKYDSFNKDALLRLSSVEDGKLKLSSGPEYRLLILPQPGKMNPNPDYMSLEVAQKLLNLIKGGLTVMVSVPPTSTPGVSSNQADIQAIANEIWGGSFETKTINNKNYQIKSLGKGRVIRTPYLVESFDNLGIEPDVTYVENGNSTDGIVWTHRSSGAKDIYFISNQQDKTRTLTLSIRNTGKIPTIYDPVTDDKYDAKTWSMENERTELPLRFDPNGSLFVIFEKATEKASADEGLNWSTFDDQFTIDNSWTVTFEGSLGGPEAPIVFDSLINWINHPDSTIMYYSGTATYETEFTFQGNPENAYLDLGEVANIAEVFVNGTSCGISWTPPYRLDISNAVINGSNQLTVAVTNTWRNRLIRDHQLPEDERITWTSAPYRLEGKPLVSSGLLGPVRVVEKQ